MEEVDCANCPDNCCLRAQVRLTVFDLAKIIYLVGDDCEFTESKNGFGEIYYKDEAFITIKEEAAPRAFIKPPCKLLSEDLLCPLHENVILDNSSLGMILRSENQPLNAKPLACAKHPYVYDFKSDSIMRLADCRDFNSGLIPVDDKDYILEALTNALFEQRILNYRWEINGEYPIVDTAVSFLGDSYQLSSKRLSNL